MTELSPAEIGIALKVLIWFSTAMAGVLGTLIVVAARIVASSIKEQKEAILKRLGQLERSVSSEFRKFDRRITRVEAVLRLHPHADDLPETTDPEG